MKFARAIAPTDRFIITRDHWLRATQLHLRGLGTDGSTTITDERGKTVTAVGDCQIDTAQYKFGGSSILFDGTGDRATVPNETAFALNATDFTIEAWVRFNALPSAGNVAAIVARWGGGTSVLRQFLVCVVNTAGAYTAFCAVSYNGSTQTNCHNASISPSTGVWYHVAFVRYNGNTYIFWDGAALGSAFAIGSNAVNSSTGELLSVGQAQSDPAGTFIYPLNGWVQDVRVTVGAARYRGTDFQVPQELRPNF